ncbi:hypothetical protein HOLleu_23081 [Holothuria leucospilota]|uniref:Uncharacterized protein n=1 Tax=Holothuria leucospilota TaxID=206669 RepID=A0A9Q1BUP7_HOLLE|nr:hypothetical protein HOLleu_23081 [Holothuria leucospilota]
MELHCILSVIGLSAIYLGSLIENCYGEQNMTEMVTKTTPEFYTEIITELITYMDDNYTTDEPQEHSSRRTTPSVPRTPRPTKPKDMTMYPSSRAPNHPFRDGDDMLGLDRSRLSGVERHGFSLRSGSFVSSFTLAVVSQSVMKERKFNSTGNRDYGCNDTTGLWIAIAVVCLAAIIVVFFLLASVVLRWRRKEESSYDLDRENAHANPAYESGEIAGLEPANGLQEVRIGLTTFPDDESKTVL